jgi:hypothetical protein
MAEPTLTAGQQSEILKRLDRGEIPDNIARDMDISKHRLSALLSRLKVLNSGRSLDLSTVLPAFKQHTVYTLLSDIAASSGVTVEAYMRTVVRLLKQDREDNNLLELRAFASQQLRTGVLPMRAANKPVDRPKQDIPYTAQDTTTLAPKGTIDNPDDWPDWDDLPANKPAPALLPSASKLERLPDAENPLTKIQVEHAAMLAKRPVGRPPKGKEYGQDDLNQNDHNIINSYPTHAWNDVYEEIIKQKQAGVPVTVPMYVADAPLKVSLNPAIQKFIDECD